MQQSIYQSKFQEMFPEIEPIIKGDALAILNLVSNTGLQERYVAKSDKLIELEKEKALAWQLKEKSDLLWNKISKNAINQGEYRYKNSAEDPNLPHIRCKPLDYHQYRQDGIGTLISSIVAQETELNAYPQYWELARRISYNVDSFYDNICISVERESKGTAGEDEVFEYLRQISAQTPTSRVIRGLVLPAADGDFANTAETDMLIVTAKGIFVCEIKNYAKTGQTLQVNPDGTFVKLGSKGDELSNYGSPFEQNERHCKAVCQVLEKRGLNNVPVYPVVVLSNPDVNIRNHSSMVVANKYMLGDVLRTTEYASVLTLDQIANVYHVLQENRVVERSFRIDSVPYEMYDSCLDMLLVYVERYDDWRSDCSMRLTEWAASCNALWVEMNRPTIAEEEAEKQRQKEAEDAEKQKRRRVTIAVCCVVAALIITLICIFWEQFLMLLSIVVTLGFFSFLFKLFFGD